jgi:hypothetical protein
MNWPLCMPQRIAPLGFSYSGIQRTLGRQSPLINVSHLSEMGSGLHRFNKNEGRAARVRSVLAGLLALGLLVLSACQTSKGIASSDLSEPGWQLRQGQAVWRMPGHRPELAGELTFAIHHDGRCLVEFSKTPFSLVRARTANPRWEIEFPPQKLYFTGMGRFPSRLAWLQVCQALAGGDVRAPWSFNRRAQGSWCLENRRSGERIEGYLEP